MNTAFRDGFQSVYGARVLTEDFMPAVKVCAEAGQTHFEAGGGARFQAPFFYCNESAFDMMDRFREVAGPDANLQTLARGINVVGLESQSRDIIDLHAKMFKKHGMTTIRNFDALNDVNNLIDSAKSITNHGLKHEVVVTMMELPPGCSGAHTVEFYMKTLQDILDAQIPFDSVCFKDASGTSVPKKVFDTISAARKILPADTKIAFHSHETAGIGTVGYVAAIKAGADQVDCSLAPASGGTCQPDVATLWHALRGENYELDVDIDKMMEAAAVFKDCMSDYFIPPEAKAVEPMIPWSPMPGGALTANTQMMRDNNLMDKYEECISAMSEVVKRGGFATSVTPVSQFYFQQAFNNVIFGPWEKFAEGYGKMVLGYFGKTPVEPDSEIIELASKKMNLQPTKENPVDLNDADPKKGIDAATKLLIDNELDVTDENIFIAAACKQKGIDFLLGKVEINGVRKHSLMPKEAEAGGDGTYSVSIDNKIYNVKINGDEAIVNGQSFNISVNDGDVEDSSNNSNGSSEGSEIVSPMNAKVISVNLNVGDVVNEGDIVFIVEAMKMEVEVKAASSGKISSIDAKAGDQVSSGDKMATIN
ncbi:MAG: biotin/lipoyl-containing protein [Verrucomicrobiota bacterium]|nr:biotin/lipoyl-containing protein [Verrucomicrobiota bacterium]MEC7908447.1 biotin/lipoyl-containing protein [Verrucomicrobiota bacterium]MEC8517601.1 biotin/lipoyl-containing protein [Verrucomicrobiota bacterium]